MAAKITFLKAYIHKLMETGVVPKKENKNLSQEKNNNFPTFPIKVGKWIGYKSKGDDTTD